MLFSQTLNKKYTKTPNVFFEDVLYAKGTTFNEAKLMGYLIRNTLVYNHRAAWISVSRSKLSQNAHISYGSINPTIQSCIKKGWILEVKQGDKGREERYLFLRTPYTEQIVHKLEEGELQLSDLGALTHVDVEDGGVRLQGNKTNAIPVPCSKHEYPYTHYDQVPGINSEPGRSIDEQVTYSSAELGCSTIEQAPCTVNEEDPRSKFDQVNTLLGQICQGVEAPLKTITKDKSKKDKKHHNTQQQHVVVVQKRIMDLFNKRISRKNVESLILLAEKENVDLDDTIQNTYEYHTTSERCRNVFGAIKYALENGHWDILDTTGSTYYGTRVSPLLVMTQEHTPRRVYDVPPIEMLRSMYGL